MESVADIKSNIQIKRIVERLERNDIAGAIEALYLDPAAFRPLDRAIAQAFEGGGVAAVSDMPTLREPNGGKFITRFDMRNYRAEAVLRERSGNLIGGIVEDIRLAARTTMEAGLVEGRGPRSIALDLVGRINRVTGVRDGGIIGLTSTQAGYVQLARDELLSNDPDRLPGPIRTALIRALAAFVLVSGSYLYGKREGRQEIAIERLQSDIKAERERIDSDANVQNLNDYDFCVQSLRSRKMPVEPCEQLRGL